MYQKVIIKYASKRRKRNLTKGKVNRFCALPSDEIWSLPKYHIWGRDLMHKED